MSGRSKGEGSIYWHEGRQLWAASVELGYDANGKRKRKYLYAKKKTALVAKLKDARRDLDAGVLEERDDTLSVEAYLADWLETVVPERVRSATAADYAYTLKRYVIPYVGKKKLAQLSVTDVERMLAELRKAGYSPRTRQYARSILRTALKHAEARGLVVRNVAALSTPPKMGDDQSAKDLDRFTEDEAAALLKAAAKHPLGAMVVVPLATGLRKGECLALRWQDLDLESDTPHLRVTGTLRRVRGGGLVRYDPKTRESRRTVPLPKAALKALRDRKRFQAEERLKAGPLWEDVDGYVLTTPIGTLLDPRNTQRDFRDICAAAGVRHRPQRLLRHSAAAMMLRAGAPLHSVSETLGHTDIRLTKAVYAGFLEPEQRLTAEAMNKALG